MTAAQFLRNLSQAVPDKIHTILTDNGIQFTNRGRHRDACGPSFDRLCQEHDSEHRLTQINHPWTNGPGERINRTLQEATVSRDYDQTQRPLREH